MADYNLNDGLKTLQNLIGYSFKNLNLLIEALTHPSFKQYIHNNTQYQNYERLELLGDAILNFIITEFLFHKFTNCNEGLLAKMRAAAVCKDAICAVSNKLGLANYIIMTHGEETSGGRSNNNNIENAMEAIIAAIYLDSDIKVIQKIIINLWSELLYNIDLKHADPKTAIQEWGQSKGYGKPIYKLITKTGPAHAPTFIITAQIGDYMATASGQSIKAAEKTAAKQILDMI